MSVPAEGSRLPELIYVGDPLCSWCWGFAPSLRRVREAHPDRLNYRLIVGGLRTGPSATRLDDELRAYLTGAWREVERRSGQPFDHDSLAAANFVYDTEPACRAVVTARSMHPELAFDFNEAVQDAFYRRGLDPTARDTFAGAARDVGIPTERFKEQLDSEAMARATREDFEAARALGVHGFPAVLVRDAGHIESIARGWMSPEALIVALRPWLS